MTTPYFDVSTTRSITIGNLTIERDGDHLALFGDLDIRRDQQGLRAINAHYVQICAFRNLLEHIPSLPERVNEPAKSTIANPMYGWLCFQRKKVPPIWRIGHKLSAPSSRS